MKVKGQITIVCAMFFLAIFPVMIIFVMLAQKELASAYFLYASQSAKENLKASYCRELFEKYDLFLLWENQNSAEESLLEVLEKYEDPAMGAEAYWNPLILYQNPEIDIYAYRMAVDQSGKFLEEQIIQTEKELVMLDSVLSAWDQYRQYEKGSELFQSVPEKQKDLVQEGKNKNQTEEIVSEEEKIQSISLLELLKSLKQKPMTTLILGTEETTNRVVPFSYGCFWEDAEDKDLDLAAGFYGKYLISNYMKKHFCHYLDGMEKGDCYELEYILSGQKSDQENLEKMWEKFVLWKGAINLASAFTNEQITAKAEAVTTTSVLGWFGGTIAAESGKLAVLAAWSYGEAILDARRIANGHKVVLWKESDDWNMIGENAVSLLEDSDSCMVSDPKGIGYADYLAYLLLLEDSENVRTRMMEIMQWNMQKENPYFSLEHCICSVEYELQANPIWMIGDANAQWNQILYHDSLEFGMS